MWTRKLLKDNAKQALRGRYWRVFLVCLVGALLTGQLNTGSSAGSDSSAIGTVDLGPVAVNTVNPAIQRLLYLLLPLGLLLTVLLLLALFLVVQALFMSIVRVGWCRYMNLNRSEEPLFLTLFSGFGPNYWSLVRGCFYSDIRIFLYTLLLIVPGIIKGYEYRFVPYLLAENPQLAPARAAELSSIMSDGEKWRMFVLDLSFIGWRLLGALLFGVGTLFVIPYYEATFAELYAAMRAKLMASGYSTEAELRPDAGPFYSDSSF